jgi:hypothetical protein
MNQVLQRNAFRNQNNSLKNKNGVIDLMHVSLKQIHMLTTFDLFAVILKAAAIYILKYVIKEINLLFFKCVQMFHHKFKQKGKRGESSSSYQARSGTSADLFAVMILLNFYVYVLIYYYFIASHLIYFIVVFVCRALRPPNTDRRPFLGLSTTRFSRRWLKRGRRFLRLPRSWRSERPNMRLARSRTLERPNTRLPRSRMLRMRLVTSHRSPTC